MTDEQIYQIGLQKRNKQIILSWNQIIQKYGLEDKFINGEQLRNHIRHEFEKRSKIKQIDNKIQNTNDNQLKDIYRLQKEKYKIRDERNLLNDLVRKEARFENIIDLFTDAIKQSKMDNFTYIPNNIKSNNKFTVSIWSDFHCGAKFDNYWGKYSIDIFKERFFKYINQIIDKSKFHNSRDLVVLGLGDYVNGFIHTGLRITNECDVVKQTQIVAETMAEGLNILHSHFNTIDFYSIVGNHDRCTADKKENLYLESFGMFIPWYIKARCSNLKNVIIHDNEIDEGIIVAKKNDINIIGVHGELDRAESIVQNMTLMLKLPIDLLVFGHLHHFACDTVQGIRTLLSGSMAGTDNHSKEIRKVGYASQEMIIYNDNKREAIYDIELD